MTEESMKDYEDEINESLKADRRIDTEESMAMDKYRKMMEDKTKVSVKVMTVVKGGCVAYVENTRGFIPASQVSTKYVENLDDYINKRLDVIITDINDEKKSLVLSHKAVEMEEEEKEKKIRLSQIVVGETMTGKVESIKDYGAFIDLGGIDGLLHISQMSWKRIKSPSVVVKLGDEVKVKVLSVEDGKISLSMKALLPAPGEIAEEDEETTNEETGGFKYEEKGQAVTNLGDLIKNLK